VAAPVFSKKESAHWNSCTRCLISASPKALILSSTLKNSSRSLRTWLVTWFCQSYFCSEKDSPALKTTGDTSVTTNCTWNSLIKGNLKINSALSHPPRIVLSLIARSQSKRKWLLTRNSVLSKILLLTALVAVLQVPPWTEVETLSWEVLEVPDPLALI
jgi:hypothetical protein